MLSWPRGPHPDDGVWGSGGMKTQISQLVL